MLELTIYGLMGLAVMLITAFCFACADDFAPAREKYGLDPVNSAQFNNSQMIKTGIGNPQFRRTVVKQQENAAPASLRQTASPAETVHRAISSDRCRSVRGQVEVLHG
jgi:hypothetical protein